MKTTIQTTGSTVTLVYACDCGKRHVREFFVPSSGREGYVRERLRDGNTRQVCDRLLLSGSTLISDSERLPSLIRDEWKRFRYSQKKWGACLLS